MAFDYVNAMVTKVPKTINLKILQIMTLETVFT